MREPPARTKVVVRRLPPTLSHSDFVSQIHDRFSSRFHSLLFRPGKPSQKDQRHSRAYIDFNSAEDVIEFAEFFDGHVFVNEKGAQYKTVVEYAPSQRVPKPTSKKDNREGTIYKDPDYLEFLKVIAKPVEHLPSAEIQLERKEAEQAGTGKDAPIITPLMEYVRQKRSIGSGSQGSIVVRKISRRSSVPSSRKPGSSNPKREKKKYVLKDKTKSSRKDRSNFVVVARHEDQLPSSSGKEASENDIGSISDLTGNTDFGKKKILLLKGKKPEAPQQDISPGNSPVVAQVKHNNQRREGSGRVIRSILLNNDARQAPTSTPVPSQQKTQVLNSDNMKHQPRPSNARSGMNGHATHKETEGDRKKDLDEKFAKKDPHNLSNVGEKSEKRTRNRDRPDRGVWAPLRRSDGSHISDERTSSSASQPTQLLSETAEGSQRNFGRRGNSHNVKEEGTPNTSEGKSSKRGANVHGSHEKQVWVQKSSAGS